MSMHLALETGVIWSIVWISATLFLFHLFNSAHGQPSQYNIVNSTISSWKNNEDSRYYYLSSGERARTILVREVDSNSTFPRFVCGFISDSNSCESSSFAIFTVVLDDYAGEMTSEPRVVWSFNRNRRVGCSATLQLTGDGDLILKDGDGTLVWSTNTKGKSVAGLNLTESGNLVLFDTNNSTVWQSFDDQPTDTLLPGQKLYSGQKLTSSTSSRNWSQGLYSVSLTQGVLSAIIESDPSLVYYSWGDSWVDTVSAAQMYAMLLKESFAIFLPSSNLTTGSWNLSTFPLGSSLQHVRLDFDGHFRVYDWGESSWKVVDDILTSLGSCDYPSVCGKYGICSIERLDGSALCSCPQLADNTNSSYFKQISERDPNLGCSEINPLSCKESKSQKLVELKNISYWRRDEGPYIRNTDLESCKLSCLNNCSCKAAMFLQYYNECYLVPQVFSLINTESSDPYFDLNFLLKVQDESGKPTQPSTAPVTERFRRKTSQNLVMLGWSLGAFSGLLLVVGIFIVLSRKKRDADDDVEEDYLDQVPGMPKRYCYEDILATTDNFSKKVGQGGFGSVFEGALSDGTMVAVKCLDGLGQIKESFLSEVKTIGSVHHLNLVRLIGYCSNKSHRLLVYEYMPNGSLDKWIFPGTRNLSLDWQTRRMIILDIAKGLAYLHDGCSQKILHLDIKPQNILLNENFRAKVSDFGLSKLIDRDQSQVVTRMKGTPGYMAPEWLNSVITEKVDVYSFGVVVLEILCGRKNIDRSQHEEDMHLLSIFKRKEEQEQLLDMIDKKCDDMCSNGAEVIKMMKVAAWCLQGDFVKRPSMSIVVKVLEGLVDVEENLEYDFSFPPRGTSVPGSKSGGSNVATSILPSILSGPR